MKNMWRRIALSLCMVGLIFVCTGCAAIKSGLENLGGWNTGEEIADVETEEQEESKQPVKEPTDGAGKPSGDGAASKEPVSNEGGDKLPEVVEIPMNTDKAGEGLSVEYVETIGNSVLFKVINNSNVCYESVTYTVLFVPDAKEFYTENGTSAWHMISGEVPAHSETYELFETPTYEKLAGEKEGSNSDKIYYDVVTIGEIVGIGIREYVVSNRKMQNASEYVEVTEDVNSGIGQVALFGNKVKKKINFEAYVVYDGEEAGFVESAGFIPAKGSKVVDPRPNPGHVYCEDSDDYRTVGYAGSLVAPAKLHGMTLGEKYANGESLYTADLEGYSNYRFIIARAYFEIP